MSADTAATRRRIEELLRERFEPLRLEIRDDSARHAGHPGATSGGGHFHVLLVTAAFEGRPRLERHRMVHEALGGLIGGAIHALGLRLLTPAESATEPASR